MESAAPAAVLFADVSDSTRLYEWAGDEIASAAIDRCVSLLKAKTTGGGGRVIKTMGDEIMALFPCADAAAHAAIEMQNGVALLDPVAGHKLGIRVGFNAGPVLERDGDIFGDAVNVAARLCAQAQQDQIITSGETHAHLSAIVRAACRRLYSIQIKGKTQSVELVQLQWRWNETNNTLVTRIAEPLESPHATLRLKHRTTEIILDATRQSLSLGRDTSAELVINDAMASRIHCHVERRMNRFVLVDRSTNGTYVMFPDNTAVVLKREELPLHGHGWITFGQPRAATDECVEFFCDS